MLKRLLLGLLPRQAGEVYWNGQEIGDLARWIRPPCCAYTPQAPRLFSTSLRENILLGHANGAVQMDEAQLNHAVWQGQMEATGSLDELLASSSEMRRLWAEEQNDHTG